MFPIPFLAGRTKEFCLGACALICVALVSGFTDLDEYLGMVTAIIATLILFTAIASSSIQITHYHVSAKIWLLSGWGLAGVYATAFSFIGLLIQHRGYSPSSSLSMPLESFRVTRPITNVKGMGSVPLDPSYVPTMRHTELILTFLCFFCLFLTMALAGITLGLMKATYGKRGFFIVVFGALTAMAITVTIVDQAIGSIGAPYPGVFVFTMPAAVVALLISIFALSKLNKRFTKKGA